jgi:hypothetical protein
MEKVSNTEVTKTGERTEVKRRGEQAACRLSITTARKTIRDASRWQIGSFMAHDSTEVLTCQVLLSYGIHSNEEKRRLEVGSQRLERSCGGNRLEKMDGAFKLFCKRNKGLTAGRRRKERVNGETWRPEKVLIVRMN